MENLIIYIVQMKINKKISLHQFLPVSEAEIQGLLHPAEAILGYFLAPKSHVSFKVRAVGIATGYGLDD
jgi:hypothetical protein